MVEKREEHLPLSNDADFFLALQWLLKRRNKIGGRGNGCGFNVVDLLVGDGENCRGIYRGAGAFQKKKEREEEIGKEEWERKILERDWEGDMEKERKILKRDEEEE